MQRPKVKRKGFRKVSMQVIAGKHLFVGLANEG
jgi:hypothetical protein